VVRQVDQAGLVSGFLSARWQYLAMLNYEVDPAILASRVPAHTELESWRGKTYISVVGFLFRETRIRGIAVPFHRNFEEVNLRFYVRRKAQDEWRRGVVFVKEIVPRRAIALVARLLYGENYHSMPMGHHIEPEPNDLHALRSVSYSWTFQGHENSLSTAVAGGPELIADRSFDEFIAEHYWGYSGGPGRPTIEYRVDHPRWRIWRTRNATLQCDVAALYGSEFVRTLEPAPESALVAEGSDVTVRSGASIKRNS
jgi:uncharacterized protein YqjF (DUF2071 family)